MPRKAKTKAKPKDWYWEAEQDKIAADDDFKQIKSPEGWPSSGLDCVGLWFLLFNQMARSPRKGYLSDRYERAKPMDEEALVSVIGRPASVFKPLLQILLDRGIFSVNEEGIIYSRGLVRKEELRRIRAKVGKKGGLRTKTLLKHLLEQNSQQDVSIGIEGKESIYSFPNTNEKASDPNSPVLGGVQGGENFAPAKFAPAKNKANPLELLVHEAAFLQGRQHDQKALTDWRVLFTDLVERLNATLDEIAAELRRPGRMRSEKPWEFKKRWESKGSKPGKLTEDEFMRRAGAGD